MMKRHLLLSLVCLFTMVNCDKEIEGCTNINATNYASEANTDDGSCTYSADVVFWLNQSTMNHLNSTGATSIQLFVGGGLTFTWFLPMTLYETTAPDCATNSASSIVITYNVATYAGQSFEYNLKTDSGTVLMSLIFFATPNTCNAVELIY